MDGVDFTRAELEAVFLVDSADAAKHARCGRNARCRVDALARCDEDLDAFAGLAVEVPDLRTMVAGPIDGS